jgi:hypothetical protein
LLLAVAAVAVSVALTLRVAAVLAVGVVALVDIRLSRFALLT